MRRSIFMCKFMHQMGSKGICRWQLIEFIISLNQFCFNYSLQIFAASTPAKTLAFVPLSRLERATSANADLDTGGPTVNLVMPHLTLFYLHCLSRWLWLHVWLFVCTRIKPQYPVSVIIGGWVISLQLTPKPEWPVCVSFFLAAFFFLFSVLASAYLLAFRIEVFFLIERLPWKGYEASTIQSKLVKMRQSLALHSPLFSTPQRACILLKLGRTMFVCSDFLEVSRVTQNIYVH